MRTAALLLLASVSGLTQPLLSSAHAAWPAPETLVGDLRSSDRGTRSGALRVLGVEDDQISFDTDAIYQIDLRYAALGEDATQQAVLSIEVGSYAYAAVAVPQGKNWERIGLIECFCQYGSNELAEFVQIRPASTGHDELVIQEGSGGTNIYEQTENHYRVHRGDVRLLISFEGRKLSCPIGVVRPSCEVRVRWFSGNTLVEARGTFDPDKVPGVVTDIPDLQNRYATRVNCRSYRWNPASFRYEPSGPTGACQTQ